MTELVRVAALTGYVDAMLQLGVDPLPLLRAQGISPAQLANPEQLLPARAVMRLLERSAQATGCMTLCLRIAEQRAIGNLGAISLLIAHQPTLRIALATLAEYRARINSTLIISLEEFGEEALLRVDFALRQPEPSRQSTDLAMGVLARICRSTLSDSWRPRAVCFSHCAPPRDELPVYARLFGCRPEFDSEFNGILLKADELDRHNPAADVQLADHAQRLLISAVSSQEFSTVQNVEQTIRLFLPAGRATIQDCAKSLGLTVRTLQRMLEAEGRRFSELLNEARMQLSTQYLANPRMHITDIAELLGYNSVGAFTRWHSRAFGMPPRKRRKLRKFSDARSD